MPLINGPRGDRYLAYRKFHWDNPNVFKKFIEFAHIPLNEGFKTFSGHAVSERVRWYSWFETVSDDPYKLSNNHVAYLGRLLMREYPEKFADFFRTIDTYYDTTDDILLNECRGSQ